MPKRAKRHIGLDTAMTGLVWNNFVWNNVIDSSVAQHTEFYRTSRTLGYGTPYAHRNYIVLEQNSGDPDFADDMDGIIDGLAAHSYATKWFIDNIKEGNSTVGYRAENNGKGKIPNEILEKSGFLGVINGDTHTLECIYPYTDSDYDSSSKINYPGNKATWNKMNDAWVNSVDLNIENTFSGVSTYPTGGETSINLDLRDDIDIKTVLREYSVKRIISLQDPDTKKIVFNHEFYDTIDVKSQKVVFDHSLVPADEKKYKMIIEVRAVDLMLLGWRGFGDTYLSDLYPANNKIEREIILKRGAGPIANVNGETQDGFVIKKTIEYDDAEDYQDAVEDGDEEEIEHQGSNTIIKNKKRKIKSYLWLDDKGNPLGEDNDQDDFDLVVSATNSGSYPVRLVVTDSTGETDSITGYVEVVIEVDGEEKQSDIPQSCDPNELVGTLGRGDPDTERCVLPGEWLDYTIYFENQTNATASAQEILVTLPLDKNLDLSTFTLGEVAFNNQFDLNLVGKQTGISEVQVDGTNYFVRTKVEQNNGTVQWYLRIVDKTTQYEWPEDPYAGFLPPNNPTNHCGEGHLSYRIKVRDDAPTGARIDASATIVFDYNEPIETDPAWWNNVGLAASDNYKYTAEDVVGVYNGNGYGLTVNVTNLASAATVKFAENQNGPWVDALAYTNVCQNKQIFFKISAEGYEDLISSKTVTITPRDIDNVALGAIADQVYTGSAIEPSVTVADGDPSIMKASDYTVSYSNNVDVGTATVTLTGMGNYMGTTNVTFEITKRPLTITSPTKSRAYDGTALTFTADEITATGYADDEVLAYSGFAAQTVVGSTEAAFTVADSDTAKMSNYEITISNGTLTVTKASVVPDSGDGDGSGSDGGDDTGDGSASGGNNEPGGDDLVVPDGGISKYDVTAEYDGKEHTINTNALEAITLVGAKPIFEYGLAKDGPWADIAPAWTDVVVTSVWYRISADNYDDFVHEAKVSITPRDISKVAIEPIADYDCTGSAIEPNVTVTDIVDGSDIIKTGDYDVSYSDNVNVGTATVTLTGKRNYTGATNVTFTIKENVSTILSAILDWRYNSASGTYYARLQVTKVGSSAIRDLAFIFADRVQSGKAYAQLWNTPSYSPLNNKVWLLDGTSARYVSLDAAKLNDGYENYGVSAATMRSTASVPAAERLIELYVRRRISPVSGNETNAEVDNFIGYLRYTVEETDYYLPIVAGDPQSGTVASPMPTSIATMNLASALNVPAAASLEPICEIDTFNVGEDEISGTFTVKASANGSELVVGTLGGNVTVKLLGAKELGAGFTELNRAVVSIADKRFSFAKPGDYKFFKVKLEIGDVYE